VQTLSKIIDVRWLQSQLLFKIFSSAKLAVPVLMVLAAVIGFGTLVESRYNADYAKILVYNTWWFDGLLGVLGVVVFLATLSRWPWRVRHVGFLITHLGMIVILIGSVFTKLWGIDGQLMVYEGEQGNQVTLGERVFEFSGPRVFKKILVPRVGEKKTAAGLKPQNRQIAEHFKIVEYVPFVKPSAEIPQFESGQLLGFRIQSQFFDQEEWLHSTGKPQMQMGPALIRMVESPTKSPAAKSIRKSRPGEAVLILDMNSGAELAAVSLDRLRGGLSVGGVKLKLKQVFKFASVSSNKIVEGEGGPPNPAVEIEFQKNGKSFRDVLFAKFPDFSLLKENELNIRAKYQVELSSAQQNRDAANIIEFVVPQGGPPSIHLLKNGQTVLREPAQLNVPVQTPWMGMKITLTRVNNGHDPNPGALEPTPIDPAPKSDALPPSAIRVQPVSDPKADFWLVEGATREVNVGGEMHQVYYGRNSIRLPFSLGLKKFHKINYPGTDTAMEFASDIEVAGENIPQTISMNEPLKRAGYTLYQSSYDLSPGRPALSIFSVNRDPGRWIKYLGSAILAVGIITFTVMRSRLVRPRN
jgi:hypothetical protein